MRTLIAMAAGALLFTASALVAATPVQPSPAGYSANSLTADVRPAGLRLKGPQPGERQSRDTAIHTIFTGSFFDAAGHEYDAAGTGDFFPAVGSIKYTVTLNGYALVPPSSNVIDFGTLSGLGIMEDGRFQIYGVLNSKGYTLDVTGVISNGWVTGEFRLVGNAGSGQGVFTGR